MKGYHGEVSLGLYEKAMPSNLDWQEKLKLAGACGCDFLELSVDETPEKLARLSWTDAEICALKRASEEAKIPIGSLCLSAHRKFALGSKDGTARAESLRIAKRAIRLSAALGIRIVQLAGYDVYYEVGGEDTKAYFRENLARCCEYAALYGVTLAFETMETPFMNTVQKAMRYVERIDSPYLQVYPDIGNITNATVDVIGDLETGRGRIVAAHLKETRAGIYRNLEYGQGRVDFAADISALLRLGVRRFVCEFWYDGKSAPEEYLCRNVGFIKQCFERVT